MHRAAPTALGLGFLLVGLLQITGCGGEAYPENLTYPLRSDPLIKIVDQPKEEPTGFYKPGELFTVFDDGKSPLDPILLYPGTDPRPKKYGGQRGEGLRPEDREKLEEGLEKLFGTPADPYVAGPTKKLKGISSAARGLLKLRDATLEKGSRLYRLNCLHCHGLTGDGRGPTAPWVDPHPRDYRLGIFKFTSSKQDQGVRKPRREDLARTIREGVEGTSMPSFKLLDDDDVEALVSYVIHLSLRGETEFLVMQQLLKPKHGVKNIDKELRDWLSILANDRWLGAANPMNAIDPSERDYPYKTKKGQPIQPRGSYPQEEQEAVDKALTESVRNGQKLFKDRGCIGCHIDYGRQTRYLFDAWGTIVRPANLTLGVYRGGRRPIDLYYRVHAGINGVNMPALISSDPADDKGRQAQEKVVWDIVNFLQVLPYQEMRRKYRLQIDNEVFAE
jgi:mono/diheme cytochrome c family protein